LRQRRFEVARIRAVAKPQETGPESALARAKRAVLFLERVSPALSRVDSSSGAIGAAVNKAIALLVPIIAGAAVDTRTRNLWPDRLWEAHANDEIPYIETLAEHWGEMCASAEVASAWADSLVGGVKMAWSTDPSLRGFFHGTPACLSALFQAGRYHH
jgi:hypothetical protein